MKVKVFVIVALVTIVALGIMGIASIRKDNSQAQKDEQTAKLIANVDSLLVLQHKSDSIIKAQSIRIAVLEKSQKAQDAKIKENHRIAYNAIKGLALKYAIDYYGGY